MIDINIKEPYYAAGRDYGWLEEHKSPGLGIRRSLLLGEGTLRVTVKNSKTVYRIDKNFARNISVKYDSTYVVEDDYGNQIELAVIPWSAFVRDDEPVKTKKTLLEY